MQTAIQLTFQGSPVSCAQLDLHADSAGLPPAASALQALRTLELRAGPKFDPDVLASLSRLEVPFVSSSTLGWTGCQQAVAGLRVTCVSIQPQVRPSHPCEPVAP